MDVAQSTSMVVLAVTSSPSDDMSRFQSPVVPESSGAVCISAQCQRRFDDQIDVAINRPIDELPLGPIHVYLTKVVFLGEVEGSVVHRDVRRFLYDEGVPLFARIVYVVRGVAIGEPERPIQGRGSDRKSAELLGLFGAPKGHFGDVGAVDIPGEENDVLDSLAHHVV